MVFEVKAANRIMPTDNKESITVSEAGRLGGLETLRRHGRQHFAVAGRRGQEVIAHRYSTDDRRRWGRLGGRPKNNISQHGEERQSR